jgi:carbon-monoxide dehydrogenase small subunit
VDDKYATLTINGEGHAVEWEDLGASLLSVLRDALHLYGTKNACEQGECGSCLVIVDGQLLCSCLTLAAAAVGRDVVTIEGLSERDDLTQRISRAFVAAGAVQCGFCIPGFVVAARQLLAEDPRPSDNVIREALAGNLCRCTGYGRILEALRAVSDDEDGRE